MAPEGIRTGALLGRIGTQHVGQQGGVANFLIRHEFEQETILSSQASSLEIFHAVCGKTVVEEVEFNPFLVETDTDRLVVEVGLNSVDGS